jgi:hypothetical protein
MLYPINNRPLTPRSLVDRSDQRRSLQDLEGRHVLFYGNASHPLDAVPNGPSKGETYSGGPRYLIAGPPEGETALRLEHALPDRAPYKANPHGVVIQPYDTLGEVAPDQVGAARAVDHVASFQRPSYEQLDAQGNPVALAPIDRTVPDGPIIGAGVVSRYGPNQDRFSVVEAPLLIATQEYQSLLMRVARLPPNKRRVALDRFRKEVTELHQDRALAYDVSGESLHNALYRLEEAINNKDDIGAQLKALALPVTLPTARMVR